MSRANFCKWCVSDRVIMKIEANNLDTFIKVVEHCKELEELKE